MILEILKEVDRSKTSDVHFIQRKENCEIFLRKHGEYKFYKFISNEEYRKSLQRVKVLSKLDISEKRLPQDGVLEFEGESIRISTLPSIEGESSVFRLYNKNILTLDDIGLSEFKVKKIKELFDSNFSLLCISGQTGSGKTTTMKAIIKELISQNKKVISIEDPVEITVKKAVEINLNEQMGLSYERAIFASMRQDPDFITIGEVRDNKTAQAMIKAALTGHSIITTVHSGDYKSTLKRIELLSSQVGVVSDVLTCVINQSLVKDNGTVKLQAKIFLKEEEKINEY